MARAPDPVVARLSGTRLALVRLGLYRLRGALRSMSRRVASLRGLVALGAISLFGGGALIAFRAAGSDASLGWARDAVSDPNLLSLGLLAGVVLTALTTSGGPLRFSDAEHNLLLTAPLHRSALVVYKLVSYAAGAVLSALLVAVLLPATSLSRVQVFIATLFTLLFVQGASAALWLSVAALRRRCNSTNARRRLSLVASVIVIMLLAIALARFLATRQAHGLPLVPFAWVAGLWSPVATSAEFVARIVGASGLIGGLGLAIVWLDAAGQRVEVSIGSVRSGAPPARMAPPRRSSRRAPRGLAGTVPLVWTRALALRRSEARALVALPLLSALGGAALASSATRANAVNVAASIILVLWFVLPKVLVFDFRSNRHSVELTRPLPIASWRVCLAQLSVPVLVALMLQWIALGSALLVVEPVWRVPLFVIAPLLVPLTLLHYALENALFLYSPTRQVPIGRVDFDFLGRTLLEFLIKCLLLGVALAAAVLAGVGVLMVNPAAWTSAVGAAGAVLAALALAGVLTLTFGYRRA